MVTNGRPAMHFLCGTWYPGAMDTVWTTDLLAPIPSRHDDWSCATMSLRIRSVGCLHYGWIRNERTRLVEYFAYVDTPFGAVTLYNIRW